MSRKLPISDATWKQLTECNRVAVKQGWASPGVFATGVGPEYDPTSNLALLYVGKSAGPLGTLVGSNTNQTTSGAASTKWMVEKRNKSAFCQMIDLIDPSRRRIAWTNISKMDEVGGSRPLPANRWPAIAEPHLQALKEEIASLAPASSSSQLPGIAVQRLLYCWKTLVTKVGRLDFATATPG
ncbi:hypothetical protein NKH36_28455 [Mesorhizobium sp. M1312]|uniref:hypothetical protein n=1 Tax=unclassified Mesorhizobium TaxID=325217 RepID=UPI003337844E